MYLVKTPKFIQSLFPNFHWRVPETDKTIYLTFDDGPIPNVTPWVMDQLDAYDAKATFFCVGDNIRKHPQIFQEVLDRGHAVGNHTYNHLNGWGTDNIHYFHNVRRCASMVKSELFRPPYGRLLPSQAQFLQRHYQVVMWDILSGDFDPKISQEQCLANVINYAKEGSIIVLHDSLKAQEKLEYVLPKILEYFAARGYSFGALSPEVLAGRQALLKTA